MCLSEHWDGVTGRICCADACPVEGVVYSPAVADKPPTVAILHERLNTTIKVGSTLVVLTISCAGTKLMDHGERLAQIQGTLNRISDEQKKAVPATIGDLLKNPTSGKLEATATILESAKKSRRLSDPSLLACFGEIAQ